MSTNALEYEVEADGNAEAFGKANFVIYFLLSWDWGGVKVIYGDRIQFLIWITHLCHTWECSSECF